MRSGGRPSMSTGPGNYTPLANPPGKAEVVRVLKVGGMKYRTRVLLVRLDGGLAVKKIFRPGRERYLNRERFAREVLSRDFPEIPPLLDSGPNYIVSPFYPARFQYDRRTSLGLFPREVAVRLLDFLERLYSRGYAVLDAHPENFIVDLDGHLRYFDCEFLYQYGSEEKPEEFSQSWDIVGPPAQADIDRPVGGCPTWQTHWKRYVQLSFQEIRTDPPMVQHTKRQLRWALRFIPRQVDHRLPAPLRAGKASVGAAARYVNRLIEKEATQLTNRGSESSPGHTPESSL
jgi:hypothetical protein